MANGKASKEIQTLLILTLTLKFLLVPLFIGSSISDKIRSKTFVFIGCSAPLIYSDLLELARKWLQNPMSLFSLCL